MTQNQTGKLHLALKFLWPQSLFFNEQHLEPVFAEKSQNQHKYKCKLKEKKSESLWAKCKRREIVPEAVNNCVSAQQFTLTV